MISQSGIIAAAIVGVFVLYLAAKNRLGLYWGFLTGTAAGGGASSATTGGGTTGAGATTGGSG